VTSGKAAPGATTSAVALALAWQRPVLLVDADASGGDIAPGFLAARVSTAHGLVSFACATRRADTRPASALVEHLTLVPEYPTLRVLAGMRSATQADIMTGPGWARLAQALATASTMDSGVDVIVDMGRIGEKTGWPLFVAADVTALVVRPSLRSVFAATAAAEQLKSRCERVGLVVVGAGPYEPDEICGLLNLPLLGTLPDDPGTAASLIDGAGSPSKIRRSRLHRTARELAEKLRGMQRATSGAATDIEAIAS